ncbi:MAG: hypothetical protein M3220_15595 [Chloroflexota bacterium]|nr:hypothetical protein [Chloroflexota bacterium]
MENIAEVTKFEIREYANSSWVWLLMLFLLVIVPVGMLVVMHNFNGLYGQDAYAYYDYATGPLLDNLVSLQLPPRFHWPPGFPLLVVLTTIITGITPLAGQVVSLLAGGMVPVLTALLARELMPYRADRLFLLAGLFVALNGQLWQSSAVVMADTVALAAGTLGMVALARYRHRTRAPWLALAAGAFAWAIFTRLAYILVALPATIYALFLLVRLSRRQALQHAAMATTVVLLILGPMIMTTVGDLLRPDHEFLSFAAAGETYKWHPLNALQREHLTADGLLSYRLPNGLYYAIAPARSFYLSPLLALLILPGLLTIWQHRNAARLLLLVGWPTTVYLFHAGTAWQNFRFTLAYLPPLAILAAAGASTVITMVRGRARGLFTLYLVTGLAWMAIGGVILTRGFIEAMQVHVDTVHWVESAIPPNARLITFELALLFEHESTLDIQQIFFLTPSKMANLLDDNRPTYLLLDVDGAESQWQDRSPAQNFHWLRDGPGLREVGKRGPHTLFVVRE